MAIVVIGAGVGGLASAISLAAAGRDVVVLDRQSGPGGKLLPVLAGETRVDSGPTVLTMMWVFEELFDLAGLDAWQLLKPKPLDILARHFWTGDASLDLYSDQLRTVDAIGTFAGASAADSYLAFSRASRKIHDALKAPFLRAQRPTPWGLTSTMSLANLLTINPFESLWHALGRYFHDRRLRQLFGRYATYCGSSPFTAPATLMLIADVEAQGVWRLDGGMSSLAARLHETATRLGVQFKFQTDAVSIETQNGRVTGVITDKAERHVCEALVFNGDSSALFTGLLGKSTASAVRNPLSGRNSLSAITWCGRLAHEGKELVHHNVFFSDDYRTEFNQLEKDVAEDPTVYICEQEVACKLVLINSPATNLGGPPDVEKRVMERLQKAGLSAELGRTGLLKRSPREFGALYPATNGALYGKVSHGWMSTFLRPQARTRIPNLYLAGGSTHPGPGVPMATLSGMRAAEALLADQHLTKQSKATAIAGGTLTD